MITMSFMVVDPNDMRSMSPHAEMGDDGTKRWFDNGVLHRSHGPAVKYRNGETEYWVEGKQVSLN